MGMNKQSLFKVSKLYNACHSIIIVNKLKYNE